MKLIITRHGQTVGNVERLVAGPEDPLNNVGKKQAEKVTERLKNEKIAAIYTSPYKRAKKTAQAIAIYHPHAEFIVVDELKEMGHGSYANKDFDSLDWVNIPDDVESRTSMFKRAERIIKRAMNKYPDKTVLFVAHNALNKAIVRVLRKWNPEDRRSIPQNNTAITIYEINGSEVKEILFNCTKHLE